MTRREHSTSRMKSDLSKDAVHARDAYRFFIRFINNNDDMNVKTALDAMAGRGVLTEYLLRIDGLEEVILNDFADDCYLHLRDRFDEDDRVSDIVCWNFFDLGLDKDIDLVVVDFNTFTWNKEKWANLFLEWVDQNRDAFSYLWYTDSFHYSLKFLGDESEAEKKYTAYLERVKEILDMKMLTHYTYRSGNCSLLLLENGGSS